MQLIEKALCSLKSYREKYTHISDEECAVIIEAVKNEIERTIGNYPIIDLDTITREPELYYVSEKEGTERWVKHSEIVEMTLNQIVEGRFYLHKKIKKGNRNAQGN